MKKPLKTWAVLPTQWIQDGGLKDFQWRKAEGANNAAGLMVLMVLAHYAEYGSGEGTMSYTELSDRTTLSRAKVSAGLDVIQSKGLITRQTDGRSSYKLAGYDLATGWAQLPAEKLYEHGRVSFFDRLHLRRPAELDALKLYLLFVARRSRQTNFAMIGYDKIEDYSGIDRNRIRTAISLLAANGMVHVEYFPSSASEKGVANAYRLPHLDSRTHMGTLGRQLVTEPGSEFDAVPAPSLTDLFG